MTRKFLRSIFFCLMMGALFGNSVAEEVYVKNKQFKGQTLGQGMSTELTLEELAGGLDLEAVSDNGYWILGEARVPGRIQDGKVYVNVKDLKNAGLMVIHSPELGTIDISVPKTKKSSATSTPKPKRQAAQEWGGANKPTLVYFGASW